MMKRKYLGLVLFACILSLCALQPATSHAQTKEKVGILFMHTGGGDWNYSASWIPPFFNNMWGIFADGFHTGGFVGKDIDQLKCYTQIHYANAEEAAGCGVAEGTLIDVLCNEYPAGTAVHSVSEYGPNGDGSFSTDCYPDFGLPYLMMSSAAWQSTVDPATGETIAAPVLDPNAAFNPGQGIAEFIETVAWSRFGYMAELPNSYDPSKTIWKKWWYGNDAPCLDDPYCAPDSIELSNVKDAVLANTTLTDKYDFVFRHGWEGLMKDQDERGETPATSHPDSTAMAIWELIMFEDVDRIVVVHTQPRFSNMSQYGGEWKMSDFRYDPVNGSPVSRVEGKTYNQCIEELDDDYGPGWTKGTVNQSEERDAYLAEKPFDKAPLQPWPEIVDMVDNISAYKGVTTDLQFAPAYGNFDQFSQSVTKWIEHTIGSFNVPADTSASLAVVLVDHGYHGAHRDSATCDAWYNENEEMFEQVKSYILASSLPGQFSKFKVVRGFGEYAEGHYSTSDKPTAEKPFGDVMSMGEQIDNALNGTYVNSQGEIINNGDNNYEYIIAVPYYFEGFSSDYHEKKETLGNMIDELGNGNFERDSHSPDGDPWGPHDYIGYVNESTPYSGEYAVSVVLDQSVFASEVSGVPTYKGSATNPTTVIIPGPALLLPDNIGVRENLVAAVEQSVKTTIEPPLPEGVAVAPGWVKHEFGDINNVIYVWSEDMDMDGDLDVIGSSNKHPGLQPSEVAWYENRIDEGLSWNKISIRAEGDPDPIMAATGTTVADIDGDGYKDVIVGAGDFGSGGPGFVYWFKGPANPKLPGAAWIKHNVVLNKTDYVAHVYARDFDNDGDMDILASGLANNFVAINPGDFTDPTAEWEIEIIAQDSGTGMWLEDMNGNGSEDILTSYYVDGGNIAYFEYDYINNNFVFTRSDVDPAIDFTFDVSAADLNDDSHMDVIAAVVDKTAGLTGPRKIFWYEAMGDGSYTSHLVTDTTKPADTYPGDVDGDGKTDIATAALFDNKVIWYRNEPVGGTIYWPEFIVDDDINIPGDIELKDIDNDGDLDIVTCAMFGHKMVWYENQMNATNMPPWYIEQPSRAGSREPLSTDIAAPTIVEGSGSSIYWTYNDDRQQCPTDAMHTWSYQPIEGGVWTEVIADSFWWWVWTDDIGSITGPGSFAFKTAVTDCEGNTIESEVQYITIDMAPVVFYVNRSSDATLLSTDPNNPTVVEQDDVALYWQIDEDYASCSDMSITEQWSYREYGSADEWTTYTVYPDGEAGGAHTAYGWADTTVISNPNTLELQVIVTDCMQQTVETDMYYITVDMQQ